jgi:hypothetical protein
MTADATCWQKFTLSNYVFTFLVPCCDVRCDFQEKTIFRFVWICRGFMFYLCYLCPTRFLWCSCCVTVTRRVSQVEQELLTLPENLSSTPSHVLSEVHVARSFVFCVVICRSLFVLSYFFFVFWPLYCPFFFDKQFLVTALVFSNFIFFTWSLDRKPNNKMHTF